MLGHIPTQETRNHGSRKSHILRISVDALKTPITLTSTLRSTIMIQFSKLRWTNILGVITSQGSVESRATGNNVECHEEYWNPCPHIRWRWDYSHCIWWISGECKPDDEQYEFIQKHLTRKYGLKWWDNGHHDIDHFLSKMELDLRTNPAASSNASGAPQGDKAL